MTKALCSFPEEERKRIAERRAASGSGGLGYLGALDYLKRKKSNQPKAAPAPVEVHAETDTE
jgi:hypothetical protein